MSIPSEASAVAEVSPAATMVKPVETTRGDPHWPMCRCSHPMHPHKVELRRGVKMERFTCPRRRWWNQWFHPNAWQAPRPHDGT
jgi:hypothetical protein